jgi:3-hydroxyisobutyrate dehydrogenase
VLSLVEGLAETIQLAEGLDVDPATFLDIIDGGPMGPPYARIKGDAMVKREYPASFPLSGALKDAGLIRAAAESAGLEVPVIDTVARRMRRAVDAGHGDEDMAATVEAARS